MGEDADRFQRALHALYQAAGAPPLSRLVALGGEQTPRLTISDTTLSAWLTGEAVPGRASTAYFMVLIAFLRARAGTGPSDGAWTQLLTLARADRDAQRGGRPRGPGRVAEPGPVTLPAESALFSGRERAVAELMGWLDPEAGPGRGADAAAGTDVGAGTGPGGEAGRATGAGPDPSEGSTTGTGHCADPRPEPDSRRAASQRTVLVSAMAGMGGVGKTALAVHVAHLAARRGWFTGGVLFADLRGYSQDTPVDAATVADQLLRALGITGRNLPTTPEGKIDAWRLALARLADQDRPLLAVLDNVRTAGQVLPLLPASGPHRVLITSRQTLATLGVQRLELAPLEPAEAVALLDETLRLHREDDDRAAAQAADAARIAELCGRLPLALRIIGALLTEDPHRPLHDQAEELAAARLDVLALDDTDDQGRPLAVRTVFHLSYRHLSAPQARAFRLLSAAPGPDIATPAAAVLLGERTGARRLLRDLARTHLLEQPAPERWSMHDLVGLYAAELGSRQADEDRRTQALGALLDHYLAETRAASSKLEGDSAGDRFPDREDAVAWLEAERPNLVAAVTEHADSHLLTCVELVDCLRAFLSRNRWVEEMTAITRAVLDSIRALGPDGVGALAQGGPGEGFHELEATAMTNLGTSLREARSFPEAMAVHAEALQKAREIGDRFHEALALNGIALVLLDVRRFGDAIAPLTRAAAIHREDGDLRYEGRALANLGTALMRVGRDEEAYDVLDRDLAICRETGDRYGEAETLNNVGLCLRHLGRIQEALDAHQQARLVFVEVGDRYSEAECLDNLALCLRRLGRPEEAADEHAQAGALFRELRDRHSEAMAVGNRAGALQEAGRAAEAIPLHLEAAALFEETGDIHAQGVEFANLGHAYRHVHRLLNAAETFVRAAALFHATGDTAAEDAALRSLSNLPVPPDPTDAVGGNEAVRANPTPDEPSAASGPHDDSEETDEGVL
ncbi:ATP-binding protein [Peterkaempfera sp. SMS 1(5)a]|uniref:ATP-binding protein n=1 Tax=Peterkaempfera podocarpi TaxID=3232308 RepID=UPI00366FAA4C